MLHIISLNAGTASNQTHKSWFYDGYAFICVALLRIVVSYQNSKLSERQTCTHTLQHVSAFSFWIFHIRDFDGPQRISTQSCGCVEVCACVFTWQTMCEAPVSIPLVMSTHSLHRSWPKVCQPPSSHLSHDHTPLPPSQNFPTSLSIIPLPPPQLPPHSCISLP